MGRKSRRDEFRVMDSETGKIGFGRKVFRKSKV